MTQRVAVIGAGTMGHGIAHAAVVAGYDTTMYDVSPQALERGEAAIRAILDKGVELGKVSSTDRNAAKSRLRSTTNLPEAVQT